MLVSVSSALISDLLSICLSLWFLFIPPLQSAREMSHKNCTVAFILNLAHYPDSFTTALGNTAYFPPLCSQSRGPGPICQVLDCNSHEQVLCLACRCPSSASQQGLQSMFHSLSSLAHTPINKIQWLFILDLKQWAPSLSWVTVHPQNTSRTKTLS